MRQLAAMTVKGFEAFITLQQKSCRTIVPLSREICVHMTLETSKFIALQSDLDVQLHPYVDISVTKKARR